MASKFLIQELNCL